LKISFLLPQSQTLEQQKPSTKILSLDLETQDSQSRRKKASKEEGFFLATPFGISLEGTAKEGFSLLLLH